MKTEKRKMVIWYCHPYAGAPSVGMSYRPYYFCKLFNQQGLSSFVITASFHHMLSSKFDQNNIVQARVVDDVPYVTVKAPEYKGNGARRLLNMLTYAWNLFRSEKEITKITGTPDIIIVSSSHPLHYPLLQRIAVKYKAKLIFEVRDIWPLSLVQILKISPYNPFIMLLNWIEKRAYSESDAVVSLLKYALKHMEPKGLKADNFHYIPNGVLVEKSEKYNELSPKILAGLVELRRKGRFLVGYTGSMGPPNALFFLLQAMKILQHKRSNIHAILVGNGLQADGLRSFIAQNSLENVVMYESIPKNHVPEFLSNMDALYLGWNRLDLYQYGTSPNKLYDYLLSGKPIIESGGEQPSLIAKFKCGIQCEAENALIIADTLIELSSLSPEALGRMAENTKIAVHEFNYANLANKYIEIFNMLLAKKRV